MKAIFFGLLAVLLLAAPLPAQTNQTIQDLKINAEKGNAEAQLSLGLRYYGGVGVTNDDAEALKWIRKAADQNYADAQYFLGCVADDQIEAVKWWRKAAEQGFMLAQYNLGVCYRTGQGVATNYAEAAQWFRKAAEQGHAPSQSSLGAFYALGEGVPRDLVEAYKWRNLACAQGETNAIEARAALEHLMTPAQIAEAQQLTREFKPRKAIELGSSISGNDVVNSNPAATGTGFFITDDGYLVSNYLC